MKTSATRREGPGRTLRSAVDTHPVRWHDRERQRSRTGQRQESLVGVEGHALRDRDLNWPAQVPRLGSLDRPVGGERKAKPCEGHGMPRCRNRRCSAKSECLGARRTRQGVDDLAGQGTIGGDFDAQGGSVIRVAREQIVGRTKVDRDAVENDGSLICVLRRNVARRGQGSPACCEPLLDNRCPSACWATVRQPALRVGWQNRRTGSLPDRRQRMRQVRTTGHRHRQPAPIRSVPPIGPRPRAAWSQTGLSWWLERMSAGQCTRQGSVRQPPPQARAASPLPCPHEALKGLVRVLQAKTPHMQTFQKSVDRALRHLLDSLYGAVPLPE